MHYALSLMVSIVEKLLLKIIVRSKLDYSDELNCEVVCIRASLSVLHISSLVRLARPKPRSDNAYPTLACYIESHHLVHPAQACD